MDEHRQVSALALRVGCGCAVVVLWHRFSLIASRVVLCVTWCCRAGGNAAPPGAAVAASSPAAQKPATPSTATAASGFKQPTVEPAPAPAALPEKPAAKSSGKDKGSTSSSKKSDRKPEPEPPAKPAVLPKNAPIAKSLVRQVGILPCCLISCPHEPGCVFVFVCVQDEIDDLLGT